MRRVAVAFLALALSAPASTRAAHVGAGALAARTTADPWRLGFVAPGGRLVLGEDPGRGLGPTGSLGFQTAMGWAHATRVLAEHRQARAAELRLATTDPGGRTLAVRIAPDGDGAIRVTARVAGSGVGVDALGVGFRARRSERFLGFGERSDAVDQRGHVVEDYVAEGPYPPDERALVASFVPPAGYRPRDDATYFPMPWLLSTAGYGVLLDNAELSRFALGTDRGDAWSVEVEARTLSFRVLAGPRPADVLRRLTARVGRQPAVAPYFFGPWYQPRKGDERAELEALLRARVPLTLAQTYTHHLPCGDQRGREATEAARVRAFHRSGLAVTTYFNPMICRGYEPVFSEAVRRHALTRTPVGTPELYRYTGSQQFLVGQFDFTGRPGREIFGRLLGEALGRGYDGWMEDFGEYTPLGARAADGSTGVGGHNRYPVAYHCAAYAAVRGRRLAVARFQRSGWTGVAPCAQAVWGGDPTTSFGFDGLTSAVRNGLTMGLSGIGRWGSDIGGYFSLGSEGLTPELLKRWIEFGAVSGVMRTQANGFALRARVRPQISDPDVLPVWRRWARWRTRLYPYVQGADDRYRETGLPLMRHLALAFPDDPRATAREDEFLFGPDLLAAPVLGPGQRRRTLYLPPGRWIVLGDSLTGGGRMLRGGRGVTLPAPLAELPLLARAGTLLALLPADVGTLAPYGHRQVRLEDRRGRRDLLAFPRGTSRARGDSGDRFVSREGRGVWRLSVGARRRRTWTVRAALATLAHPFAPCSVRIGRRAVRFSYARRSRVLRTAFTTRHATLVVRACR